jgi:serine/threonine-protein kinase
MADSTLPPSGSDRNLLLGVLAMQLDFVTREDLQAALQAWAADRARPLGDVLVERRALAVRRRVLLEELVDEFLVQHDLSASESLAAACAAREVPVDLESLTGPALRGSLATLPSQPLTLSGNSDGVIPPPAVGTPTSSGLRFRILRPHARGALGEVFLARDEDLHREVALKEIQGPYARSVDSRKRFLMEAEITGGLEHPGIVPVYALGTYPDGRPWYVMRFIRGQSLHEAIGRFHQVDGPTRDPGERALALRGLLRRFVDVCNAVAYAHSRGVIHRDLKPSNVMLGPFGETLVVDWGLAKVMDKPCTPDSREIPIHPVSTTATATMLGQAVGTPAFMSPEQARGSVDQINAASDVYALGASLYDLLVGTPPYPGHDATMVIHQVQEHCFPLPRKVNRQVPAALEAVILKAMARHPDDRYRTVAELAQEVERWLGDEPVEAYREPAWQRAQRWARRHKTLVSGMVVLLLTAAVGLGIGLFFVRQAQAETARELARAEANLELAQKAVNDCFVLATDYPLLQKEKMRPVRKELLRKALPFFEGFRVQKPNDPEIRKELGSNLYRLAYIQDELGDKTAAIQSYEEVRGLYEQLQKENRHDPVYLINLPLICNTLGTAYKETGQRDKAFKLYAEARRLRNELPPALRKDTQADQANTLSNEAELLDQSKKPDDARRTYQQAVDILTKVARDQEQRIRKLQAQDRQDKDLPGKLDRARRDLRRYRHDLAVILHNLGILLVRQGGDNNLQVAAKVYKQARDIRDALVLADPENGRYRFDLASTLNSLADIQSDQDQLSEARDSYDRALRLLIGVTDDYPETVEYRSLLASTLYNLGRFLEFKLDRPVPARGMYLKAHEIQDALVRAYPVISIYRTELAETRYSLGRVCADAKESLHWYTQVLAVIDKGNGNEERSLRCKTLAGRAAALHKLKRYGKAVADWTAALEQSDPGDQMELRLGLAKSRAGSGDYAAALREVRDLETTVQKDEDPFYDLACVYALASAAARKDGRLSGGERDRLGERHAARAVEFLVRARKAKVFEARDRFRDDPAQYVLEDQDLEVLHDRDDFKAFVNSLKAKKAP